MRPAPPVWHAELRWADELYDHDRLTAADQRFLTTINAWLSRRRGVQVPLRERSLQIFDDEKLLETRVSRPLFAPDRLTLDLLLACEGSQSVVTLPDATYPYDRISVHLHVVGGEYV